MSESTTDKPTTGKNVGGPMYSEGTQRLLHDIAMSPNARRTLDAINAEHFNGSDDDVATVMARKEKPADSGPLYLVRPHVPAEQQEVIDLTNSRSRKLVKAERAVDELREHVRAFRRSDREGNTDAWATLNHHLLKVCIDRLQEFHNDVVEVLGSGETFTSAVTSEPRLQMVSGGTVHEVPLYVQFAMAYSGQSPDEYFAEPSDLRNSLEKTINSALLDLRERGCVLTPIADSQTADRDGWQSDASGVRSRWAGHRTFVEQLTMAIRGQSAHEYFREPDEIRRDSERRTTNALLIIGHTLAPAPDTGADDSSPTQFSAAQEERIRELASELVNAVLFGASFQRDDSPLQCGDRSQDSTHDASANCATIPGERHRVSPEVLDNAGDVGADVGLRKLGDGQVIGNGGSHVELAHKSSPSADDGGAHSVGEGEVTGVETAAPVTDATDVFTGPGLFRYDGSQAHTAAHTAANEAATRQAMTRQIGDYLSELHRQGESWHQMARLILHVFELRQKP